MFFLRFEQLWKKIVEDTNKFKEKSEGVTFYSFQSDFDNPEKFADALIFGGVWLYQRIDEDKGLRKRIRKAMNFSYP